MCEIAALSPEPPLDSQLPRLNFAISREARHSQKGALVIFSVNVRRNG